MSWDRVLPIGVQALHVAPVYGGLNDSHATCPIAPYLNDTIPLRLAKPRLLVHFNFLSLSLSL